ncbi:putative signal peptide transmembrane domain protein [Burkholderia pseudomallei MSHR1153]|nr:putative signal peptide transmembrane domain protein [Burkholderia pseudomallei MSHR1153]
MPIFVVLFALAALIWGAIHMFEAIAARFGDAVAIGAATVAAVAIAAAIARSVRRRLDIAPNAREDGWTHVLQRAWGDLRISATKGLLWLSQDGADGRYAHRPERLPRGNARRALVSGGRRARRPPRRVEAADGRQARRAALGARADAREAATSLSTAHGARIAAASRGEFEPAATVRRLDFAMIDPPPTDSLIVFECVLEGFRTPSRRLPKNLTFGLKAC